MKYKRGYRYQVAERARDIEARTEAPATAAKIGIVWLVLDTYSGDDPFLIVAVEVSRARARKLAKELNDKTRTVA